VNGDSVVLSGSALVDGFLRSQGAVFGGIGEKHGVQCFSATIAATGERFWIDCDLVRLYDSVTENARDVYRYFWISQSMELELARSNGVAEPMLSFRISHSGERRKPRPPRRTGLVREVVDLDARQRSLRRLIDEPRIVLASVPFGEELWNPLVAPSLLDECLSSLEGKQRLAAGVRAPLWWSVPFMRDYNYMDSDFAFSVIVDDDVRELEYAVTDVLVAWTIAFLMMYHPSTFHVEVCVDANSASYGLPVVTSNAVFKAGFLDKPFRVDPHASFSLYRRQSGVWGEGVKVRGTYTDILLADYLDPNSLALPV
jgi:hypothetical protein